MKKLLEFVQEDNGGLSATRLAFLLWVLGVLAVWIIASVTAQPMTLARIDPSVTTVLGILMTGKVVQKFGEKPELPVGGPSAAGPGTPPGSTSGVPGKPDPSNAEPAQRLS